MSLARSSQINDALNKITSCIHEVIGPLLEQDDPRISSYDKLLNVLKELPEYKEKERRLEELEKLVEEKTKELIHIKSQLEEMSSEGEEVVLEVRDSLNKSTDEVSDPDSENRSDTDSCGEPTFPSEPIKTIHLMDQNNYFSSNLQSSLTMDVNNTESDEGSIVESDIENDNHSETQTVSNDHSIGHPVEQDQIADEEVECKEEGKDEEEEEEEVEEVEIDGKTYFCSETTIYECTDLGDVGDECGYFEDGEAIFTNDENESYV